MQNESAFSENGVSNNLLLSRGFSYLVLVVLIMEEKSIFNQKSCLPMALRCETQIMNKMVNGQLDTLQR